MSSNLTESFDEQKALKGFWLKYLGFTEAPSPMTVQTSDSREILMIASGMSKPPYSAFFVRTRINGQAGRLEEEEFRLDLRPGLTQPWFSDYVNDKENPLHLGVGYIRLLNHLVSNNVTAKYADLREKQMMEQLRNEMTGTHWSEVVFVPQAYYASGRQFSEAVYEYLAAMVLRMMGFYVVYDYRPWGSMKMPDLSAFRTDVLREMINMLRRKKLLKYGATSAELQMIRHLGRVEPLPLLESPDVETIVVEAKKSATRYEGISQLFDHYHKAGELYDAGYTCAPFLDASNAHEYFGSLSLTGGGDIVETRGFKKLERFSTSERQELRREELDEVTTSFKLELLKNVGLQEGVALVCKGDTSTYSDFMRRLANIDPEPIIELVESKIGP